ncbi:MAG: Brp/Blh family beta-carotene 15,15'-dioxygenase [Bacteroidota bacterium]
MKSGMIVATIFSLWFSVYFDDYVETALSYILIMSFGVLHGANDIRLIQSISSNNSKSTFPKVLVTYILVVLGILALFFTIPILALSLFILISGYHFGEQHWSKSLNAQTPLKILFYVFYGLFILFMIFWIRNEQVVPILESILQFSVSPERMGQIFLFTGAGLLILGVFGYANRLVNSNVWEELFVLLVFFIIFNTASLLWGFCIYFIVWHSIPSLKDQMDHLYGEANWRTFGLYLKESILYWAVSIIGLFGLLWFLNDSSYNMVAVLIYFLAAITFPHVFVMSKLEKDAKN